MQCSQLLPLRKSCEIYDKMLMKITLCCGHIHMFREPSLGYLCVPLSLAHI